MRDVVVQFGERIDDDVLAKATEVSRGAQLSLVMGTSLKIPPANRLPRLSKTLVIVNLQWTAEDKHSKLKLNARCDDVLEALCGALGVTVCSYDPGADAIGARVLAAGETFVKDESGHRRRCDVKAEEATTFDAGEGEGDDARSVRFGVGGEGESKKHEKFAPLSKRARRMKNPSVPIPTNPATDRA